MALDLGAYLAGLAFLAGRWGAVAGAALLVMRRALPGLAGFPKLAESDRLALFEVTPR